MYYALQVYADKEMISYEELDLSSVFDAYKRACELCTNVYAVKRPKPSSCHVDIAKEHDRPYKGFYWETCPSVYYRNKAYFIKIEDKYDPKKYEFRQINPRTVRYVMKKEKGSMPFGL